MTMQIAAENTVQVLVVDDHRAARESISEILRCAGHHVRCRGSAVEALHDLERSHYDLIITDLHMPGMSGLDFIRTLHERNHDAQVLMVTAHASVTTVVEAMRCGAFDYIEKPFTADQLEELVDRAVRHGHIIERRSVVPATTSDRAAMIGDSSAMLALRSKIRQLAPTSETVLISGESGVGKELVAQAIHSASGRAGQALVSVNCPALSSQLMESELFGHERGSFTSADAPRTGRFELADHGTLLLDEVTEISLSLQAKLLRVLQEKAFERVGSSETRFVDVRVVAATNRDLREAVTAGQFREDLYFRIAVVPLTVPSLRDRREDIPQLIAHFSALAGQRLERDPCELDASAMQLLQEYHWPGNVRELENIITRACVLSGGNRVGADDLRPWLLDCDGFTVKDEEDRDRIDLPVGMNLQDMERQLIEATLERFDGHRAQTARALGIGVRTLTNKLRAYGYAPRAKSLSRAV
jgi:DNA-binding NtrC family response regulator